MQKEGIMGLAEAKRAGLSYQGKKNIVISTLKNLYSNRFLSELDDNQIFKLYEKQILLPQLQQREVKKPVAPLPIRPPLEQWLDELDREWWKPQQEPKPTPEKA